MWNIIVRLASYTWFLKGKKERHYGGLLAYFITESSCPFSHRPLSLTLSSYRRSNVVVQRWIPRNFSLRRQSSRNFCRSIFRIFFVPRESMCENSKEKRVNCATKCGFLRSWLSDPTVDWLLHHKVQSRKRMRALSFREKITLYCAIILFNFGRHKWQK